MLTNVLLDLPWLTPSLLAVLIFLGPLAGRWVAVRPRLAWWLTGLSLLPVALLTMVPVERELYARCTVQWALPTPGQVELMANVVLFVAPVLLMSIAVRRPMLALVAGSGLSAGLEALQALVPAIGRSCDTNDWLCNTLGAVIGAVLASLALRMSKPSGGAASAHRA